MYKLIKDKIIFLKLTAKSFIEMLLLNDYLKIMFRNIGLYNII